MRKFASFISKKCNFYYPDFFLPNIYFLRGHNEQKTQIKNGVTVLVSYQNWDNKGIVLASNDHFAQEEWGEFQDKNLFSQVELSKSLLKAFGLQKGPQIPLFKRPAKINVTFEVTMLCALGDVPVQWFYAITKLYVKFIKIKSFWILILAVVFSI